MVSSRGKSPSCMTLALLTICLVSITSLIVLWSPGHKAGVDGAMRGPVGNGYKELEQYIKKLEGTIAVAMVDNNNKAKFPSEGSERFQSIRPETPAITKVNNQISQVPNTAIPANQTNPLSSLEEKMTSKWINSLASKLLCLRLKSGGIYLYHTRKAAGTSIRDILTTIASTWHVPYHETEGVVLNREIVDKKNGLLTVTSLRDPVARIMSLYWYEHVGWYDGVLKQTERCKTLRQWVNAWRDGSTWKAQFISKNPDSVYVEIENYYVKMLSGWHAQNRQSRVTRADLETAKNVLRSFDLVLLSDWMGDNTQIEAMNAIFPGRSSIAAGHKVRGDHNAKVRLVPRLAPDEDEVRAILTEINALDLELFEFAQSLMAYRLKFIPPTVLNIKAQLGLDSHLNTVVSKEIFEKKKDQCAALDSSLSPQFKKKYVGIFQPPGHKGPF